MEGKIKDTITVKELIVKLLDCKPDEIVLIKRKSDEVCINKEVDIYTRSPEGFRFIC